MKPWFIHKIQCRHQRRHIVLTLALVNPRTGRVRQKPRGDDRVHLTYNGMARAFFKDREYRRAKDYLGVNLPYFAELAADVDIADIYHVFDRAT